MPESLPVGSMINITATFCKVSHESKSIAARPLSSEAHLSAVSAELLAKSERCGILCMCPANLDDVCKVFGLCIKRSLQAGMLAEYMRGQQAPPCGLGMCRVDNNNNDSDGS